MDWTAIAAGNGIIITIGTVIWATNKAALKNALAKANDDLLGRINGTYLRSAGSRLTGDEIERRLNHFDDRFDRLGEKIDGIVVTLSQMVNGGCSRCRSIQK